jgi:hypothetical protein
LTVVRGEVNNSVGGFVAGDVTRFRDAYHCLGPRARGLSPGRFAAADFGDRDAELAEIAEFCGGDQPYSWWLGDPWVGKTVLAAHAVTNPPPGVEVVSFFVSRPAGLFRLDDYLAALTAQLGYAAQDPDELWEQAAARAAERGNSLLLVVDGLDENTHGDEPSIASRLPARCPHGSHVLVTSRPYPRLPDDVRDTHPLRTCPRRALTANSRATTSERRANLDLSDHLRDPRSRRVLGLLAVSNGPLTAADLAAIVGDFHETETLVRESMARVLKPGYTLAHESLLATVVARLGADYLAERVAELHEWARRYRSWPRDTPAYLVDDYPRLLAGMKDAVRAEQLCTMRRFCLLRELTGANYLAVRELDLARSLQTDLRVIARLSLWLTALREEAWEPPSGLAKLLTRHGRRTEAEHLARSRPEPHEQARALLEIADGDQRLVDDAYALIRTCDVDEQAYLAGELGSEELLNLAIEAAHDEFAWYACASAAAELGLVDHVWRIGVHVDVTSHLATAYAIAGRAEVGEQLVAMLGSLDREVRLIEAFAKAFGKRRDIDGVNRMLEGAPSPQHAALMLAAFAEGAANDQDRQWLSSIVTSALENAPRRAAFAAAACGFGDIVEYLLPEVPDAVGAVLATLYEREPDRAMLMIHDLDDWEAQATALVDIALRHPELDLMPRIDRLMAESASPAYTAALLAGVAAKHGRPDAATRLAGQAERFVAREPDEGTRRYVMALAVRATPELSPSQLAWVERAVEWLFHRPPAPGVDYSVLEVLTTVLTVVDDAEAARIVRHLTTATDPMMAAEIAHVVGADHRPTDDEPTVRFAADWAVHPLAIRASAAALMADGELESALPLLVQLFTMGDAMAFGLVADAHPDVVPLLIDTFEQVVDFLCGRF